MNNQKSTTMTKTKSVSFAKDTVGIRIIPSRRTYRFLQDCVVIWLDANFNATNKKFQDSLSQIQRVVPSVITFTDIEECTEFMKEIKDEKLFFIVSAPMGKQIIPKIHAWPQLFSVYLFPVPQTSKEQWSKKLTKVKGLYTSIKPLFDALQNDCEQCEQALMPMYFYGIDKLFVYMRLFKEIIVDADSDDNKDIKEFIEFCRRHSEFSKDDITLIERDYRHHAPVWWYTGPYFLCSMLNRCLRTLDIEILLKMAFFIRHLHQNIRKLHGEQISANKNASVFQLYRGQALSNEDFEKVKQASGSFMSFNNFLLASSDRSGTFKKFVRPATSIPNHVGVLFFMMIDPKLCGTSNICYADIKHVAFSESQANEILFSSHPIFRIDSVEKLPDKHTDRLWQVNLTLVGNDTHEMNDIKADIHREQSRKSAGWSRLADILIKTERYQAAEELYHILLATERSDQNRLHYYLQIGSLNVGQSQYDKALSSNINALAIREKILPPNHLDLVESLDQIGDIYCKMGDVSKAIEFYERALDIAKCIPSLSRSCLADHYSNIGSLYRRTGEYSKALSSHEQALEIRRQIFASNHIDLAESYNNIGNVYYNMCQLSDALSRYKQALEIRQEILPMNHSDLLNSYNNIGLVHYAMADYSEALSYFKEVLTIKENTLDIDHPNFIPTLFIIGSIYENMSEYEEARSFYERALTISQQAVPRNHSDLADSYTYMANLHTIIGDYKAALDCHQQALKIRQEFCSKHLSNDSRALFDQICDAFAEVLQYLNVVLSHRQLPEVTQEASSNISLAIKLNSTFAETPEDSKALSSHELTSDIYQETLSKLGRGDSRALLEEINQLFARASEYSKTLLLQQKARNGHFQSYPNDSNDDLYSFNKKIDNLFEMINELSKVFSLTEQMFDVQRTCISSNPIGLASLLNMIGSLCTNMGEYPKALSTLEEALNILNTCLPSDHPYLASCCNNLGNLHFSMGSQSNALSYHEQALEIRQKKLPSYHPDLAISYNNVASLYKTMGKSSEALLFFKNALEIFEKLLPPTHINIIRTRKNIEYLEENS